MNFPLGIKVSDKVDRGSFWEFEFQVSNNELLEVSQNLVKWLDSSNSFTLCDHRRNEFEGWYSVEYKNGQYRYCKGGHGHSSDWATTTEKEVTSITDEVLKSTKFGLKFGGGSLKVGKVT